MSWLGDALRGAVDVAKFVPGLGTIAEIGSLGLGAANLLNAQTQGKKSNKLAEQALQVAQQNWAANEGLRNAGRAGMLNPKIMDLSSLLSNSGPYTPNIQLGKPGVVGMGTFS